MSNLELFRDELRSLSPPEAAKRLIGAQIIRGEMSAQIVEAEAYAGSDDPGSHAFRGLTPRTEAMFGPPGHAYIYFTYGNHWMLNVSARPEGEPCALLIRAALPLKGQDLMRPRRVKAKSDRDLLSGPGKLCQAMAIDKGLYGTDLLQEGSPIRLVPSKPVELLSQGVRVGIAKGRGDEIPWRFVDTGLIEWASRPLPRLP